MQIKKQNFFNKQNKTQLLEITILQFSNFTIPTIPTIKQSQNITLYLRFEYLSSSKRYIV